MQDTLIGFYFTVILSVYNFIKLLSYKLPRRKTSKVLLCMYVFFMPIVLYIFKVNIPYLHVPILIASMVAIFKYIYNVDLLITINSSLFSIGLTYAVLMICNITTAFLIFPILSNFSDSILLLRMISSIIRLIIDRKSVV